MRPSASNSKIPATGTAMGVSLITNLSTRSVNTVSPTTSSALNSKEKSEAKLVWASKTGRISSGPLAGSRSASVQVPSGAKKFVSRSLSRSTQAPKKARTVASWSAGM